MTCSDCNAETNTLSDICADCHDWVDCPVCGGETTQRQIDATRGCCERCFRRFIAESVQRRSA